MEYCTECGKKLYFYGISMRDYVYKIGKFKFTYQCSYPCWRKAQKKLEEKCDGQRQVNRI